MSPAVLDGAALAELQAGFGGELIQPDGDGYDPARTIFNAMVDRRPALIARCSGVSDVVSALRFARDNDLEVAVRGGGHSVTGHGLCDDGLCIDLSPMKGVRVDPSDQTAWVQAGCTWGDLDRETQAYGLAVPGGRVPSTGVAGLTLGGGSGWLERKFGYTVDSLIEADVVTADGQVVVASPDEHADLLWGLKGGGGNFGIVTAFRFQLHEVGPIMLGGMLLFPVERAEEILRAYRDYIGSAPDEVGGASAILTAPPEEFVPEEVRGKPVIGLIWCYAGPVEEGQEHLQPLRDLGPALDAVQPMPYVFVQRLIEPGNPPGNQQYWKAGFLQELSDDAIEAWVSHASKIASPFTASIMLPLGGAVARAGEDDTPLGFRDAGWNYHILSQWPDPAEEERQIAWTREFAEAMEPSSLDGVYLNFMADETGDLVQRAFGPEKYARLQELKDRYDPDNVFHLNQNVKPSAVGATA
jgi:FAD/FMN-containing dehydrogenase